MIGMRSTLVSAALLAGSCTAWSAPVAQWELGVVLTRTPDSERGASLYTTCAACHGAKGEGVSDGSVPAIAGQSYTVIAKQIVDFRAGIRKDPRMEHFVSGPHLSFSQPVADVSQYIARMTPAPAKEAPAGAKVDHGAMTYALVCARCHGEVGEGKEDTLAPRLAGQHYVYILSQLDAATNASRPTMVTSHGGFQRALTRADLESVAAYLTTLGP